MKRIAIILAAIMFSLPLRSLLSHADPMNSQELIVVDLGGYQEKIGEVSLFIIEGKVRNQSKSTKKYIKIKFAIFDENGLTLVEQEAICGRNIDREKLKNQPPEFFMGENVIIKPETEEEMIVPAGKESPFMVIFKDLPDRAKDFKFEILEAPNLSLIGERKVLTRSTVLHLLLQIAWEKKQERGQPVLPPRRTLLICRSKDFSYKESGFVLYMT